MNNALKSTLVFSLLLALGAANAQAQNVGVGTSNPPAAAIQITNCQQLQDMRNNLAGNYVLANDIDCSATRTWNVVGGQAQGFRPIGLQATPFSGSLNGMGRTVTGLYVKSTQADDYVGLFAHTGNASVSNLILKDVDFTSNGDIGGIVGFAQQRLVLDKVMVTGVLTSPTGSYIGGLIGECNPDVNNVITNSIADVRIIINNPSGSFAIVGGLVGSANANISNSYAKGSIVGNNSIRGGLVGSMDAGRIENSYAAVALSNVVSNIAKAGGLLGELRAGIVTNSFWDREIATVSVSAGSTAIYGIGTAQMKLRSSFIGFDFANTWTINENVDYPHLKWEPVAIQITNCQQLQDMRNNLAGSYILANDIDCSTQIGFVGIGDSVPFSGQFDGNNKTIKNLTVASLSRGGLFNYAQNAQIKDLRLENVRSEGGIFAGGLVSDAQNVTINNVHVTGEIRIVPGQRIKSVFFSNGFAGGICGIMRGGGSISNSSAKVKIVSQEPDYSVIGGLTGYASGQALISQSSADVSIAKGNVIGGLVGILNASTIEKSYSTGDIQGGPTTPDNPLFENEVGGLVGESYGIVIDSYSKAKLGFANIIGGLVAFNSYDPANNRIAQIRSSYFSGQISNQTTPRSATAGLFIANAYPAGIPPALNSYWDSQAVGGTVPADSFARTSAQMKQQASFFGFDFTPTTGKWKIFAGLDYPHLAWEEYPRAVKISKDIANIQDAIVDGGNIIFRAQVSGRGQLYWHNVLTNKTKRITTDAVSVLEYDADKGQVVYTDGTSIKAINLYTNENRVVTNNGNAPKVSGSKVVYDRVQGGNQQVFLHDLNGALNNETMISHLAISDARADISGNTAVWMDGANNIQLKMNVTNAVQSAAVSVGYQPRIDGNKVVFVNYGGAGQELKYYEVGGAPTPVTKATINGLQSNFSISGNWVTWAAGGDVRAYNLSANAVYQLTQDAVVQQQPMVSNDRVVFVDNRSGSNEVYMLDLNFNRQSVKFKMNVIGNGSGTVTSIPAGLNCFAAGGVEADKVCEMTVDKGTKVVPYFNSADDSELGMSLNFSKFNQPINQIKFGDMPGISKNFPEYDMTVAFEINADGELGVPFNRLTAAKVSMEFINESLAPVAKGANAQFKLRLTNKTLIAAPSKAVTVGLLQSVSTVNNITVTLPAVPAGSKANPRVIEHVITMPIANATAAGSYGVYLEGSSGRQVVTVVEPKPDLTIAVDEGKMPAQALKAGDYFMPYMTIKNNGTAAVSKATFKAVLVKDGKDVFNVEFTPVSLGVGQSTTLQGSMGIIRDSVPAGQYTVKAVVDFGKTVAESDENNNTYQSSKTLTVLPKVTGKVVASNGQPAAGWTIYQFNMQNWSYVAVATTDAKGNYQVKDVAPGNYYFLVPTPWSWYGYNYWYYGWKYVSVGVSDVSL